MMRMIVLIVEKGTRWKIDRMRLRLHHFNEATMR